MQDNSRLIKTYQKKYGKNAKAKLKQDQASYADKDFELNPNVLMSAYNAWVALHPWRKEIFRNEQFVYGDQHSDLVYDYKSKRTVTERRLFIEQGLQPSQYNIIRNILRTIAGVWISNKTLPVCVAQKDENQLESDVLTATLHTVYRKNELRKLRYAQFIQLLISGLMATDINYVNREGDSDVVHDYIDPFAFIIDNNMKDPRYKDCTLVGYFYDLPIEGIAGLFSNGSPARAQKIRDLYRGDSEERILSVTSTFTDERLEKDFFTPGPEAYGLGRVIKVQRKETAPCFWVHNRLKGTYVSDFKVTEPELKALYNQMAAEQTAMGVLPEDQLLIDWKWGTDTFWKFYYLTPYGEVLSEEINPYWHKQPSIVFELHEWFIGKIYPFVKDLIDTQKQINKLSAISELLSKYSAKSLLLMPVKSIAEADGYGIDYIEQNMTNFDAVIPYNADNSLPNGGKPEFTNTVAQAFTPLNVVNMYMKLSENVSGVFGALQGSQPTAGTPAQMYAQQSQNSATSLNGIFESVSSFQIRGDKITVQEMQQFYKGKRYIYEKKSGKFLLYDEEKVKNVDTEISIVENTDTPAYRLMMNDLLFQLKEFDTNNVLDLRGMLEAGNLPFKDQLLDYVNKREQQLKEMTMGGQPGQPQEPLAMPPELQQQLSKYQFPPDLMAKFTTLPPEIQQQILQEGANPTQQPS